MDLSTKLEIVSRSDVGRRRPHNEDSTIADNRQGVAILADGMGGYKAGEVASALAVTQIYHDISSQLKKLKKEQVDQESGYLQQSLLLKRAIIDANTKIVSTAQQGEQYQGMGTTIIAVLFFENKLALAHVGDSRVYRFRNNDLQQITRDHSLIPELIDRGMYTPEEAHAKTPKNLVTRAMGIDNKVEVDLKEETAVPGDIYLLCSDGLNDMVADEEIHLTLSKYSANLVQTADNLVQSANRHGGKDNISVILVRVLEEYSSPRNFIEKLTTRFKKTGKKD